MHPNYYLPPLAIALMLGMNSPAKALSPLKVHHLSFLELKQKFQLLVPEGETVSPPQNNINSLKFVKQHRDNIKIMHVRMQQQYLNIPVFGGYLIIHSPYSAQSLTSTSSKLRMTGVVYEDLASELGALPSSFLAQAPLVLQQFKKQYEQGRLSEEQVDPLIYVDEKHQAHWAYKVSLFVQYSDRIPERPTAIIDASTGKPWVQWNNLKTKMVPAMGQGFGGNSKIGALLYGKDLPLLEITRNTTTETCFMENKHVKVVDMMHKYNLKNTVMKFPCLKKTSNKESALPFYTGYLGDGYDKENGAYSPSNDALYAGYVVKHMYHDWYGIEVLTKADGSPMKLIMRVHYGLSYENAYWDGRQMTFGDGDSVMYPLVSSGVCSHEVSHGFTEQQSDLEYFGQSGGLNESFSDMAAQAAEFYSVGTSSWKIGSEIMKEDSGYDALRYLDKPSRDGMSIDRADEYYGGLDVHYSSGVFNRFFYLLSHQPNWNVRKSFDVMVKANMDYWTPYTGFEEAACGVLNAAEDLQYPLSDIKKSLDAVAVNYQSCSVDD